MLRQLAGGLEHRGGGLAGLLGALGDAGDVAAHLLGAALKECLALRGRGSSPRGFGDVWSIRQYRRDGVATAEQLAEAYGLRPEFIAAVAGPR